VQSTEISHLESNEKFYSANFVLLARIAAGIKPVNRGILLLLLIFIIRYKAFASVNNDNCNSITAKGKSDAALS
jgi:hypothetical protein